MANYSGGIPAGRSIAELLPELGLEWHPSKNGNFGPSDFGVKSKKFVWWLCTQGHEWEQSVATRSNGQRCPQCPPPDLESGSLRSLRPDLSMEWHPSLNGVLTPDNVRARTHVEIWWLCNNGHEWTAAPHVRHKGMAGSCIKCRSVAWVTPALAPEWHPSLNAGRTPETVLSGSDYMAWWSCHTCSFEWQAAVSSRKFGAGCPECGRSNSIAERRRSKEGVSFGDLHPDLTADWHPTLNGTRTPFNVNPGCKDLIWWQCRLGHEYQSRPLARRHGRGCPYCAGRKIGYGNDLASKYPEIAKEWHPLKNRSVRSSEVAPNTHTIYWWQCPVGHEWKTSPNGRVNRLAGCPGCVSKATSEQEKRLLAELSNDLPELRSSGILVEDWLTQCDMVDHGNSLIVEFDGSYWHRGKEGLDKAKATRLRNAGWTVVRVREFPLLPLHPDDVQVPRLPALEAPVEAGEIVRAHLAGLLDLGDQGLPVSWLHEAGLGF